MSACNLLALTDILWKLLEVHGRDPEPLFTRAGISPDAIKTAGARVPFSVIDRLWREASQIITDPCFGLRAGEFWHPSHWHALGYAWLSSRTLRDGLNRVQRYSHMLSPTAEIVLEDNKAGLTLILESAPGIAPRPNRIDALFASLLEMCRINYGREFNLVSVKLRREKPPCFQAYQEIFEAPVEFEAAQDSLILPSAAVDQPLISDNPQLVLLHDRIIIDYLAKLKKGNIVNRVKAAILNRLPSGEASQQKVAPLVGLSVRSLQRKLKGQDTSYQKLVDEIRSELAHSYISDMETDLTEIAFLIGFSEQSAFSRAFKRWTGKSPKQVREALPA